MADKDHEAGIRAAVEAIDRINEGQEDLSVTPRDEEIFINLAGLSREQIAEAAVDAYLKASGMTK